MHLRSNIWGAEAADECKTCPCAVKSAGAGGGGGVHSLVQLHSRRFPGGHSAQQHALSCCPSRHGQAGQQASTQPARLSRTWWPAPGCCPAQRVNVKTAQLQAALSRLRTTEGTCRCDQPLSRPHLHAILGGHLLQLRRIVVVTHTAKVGGGARHLRAAAAAAAVVDRAAIKQEGQQQACGRRAEHASCRRQAAAEARRKYKQRRCG